MRSRQGRSDPEPYLWPLANRYVQSRRAGKRNASPHRATARPYLSGLDMGRRIAPPARLLLCTADPTPSHRLAQQPFPNPCKKSA